MIDSQAAALELWCGSRCRAAEDVVQEAFCRLAALEPPPDNPVGWLYRVCRNLAEKQRLTDDRRRRRERTKAEQAAIASAAADPLELAETLAAVERLDAELREVFVARIWGQLSLAEIGQLCGISAATAHRRYRSALETLRSLLAARLREANDERATPSIPRWNRSPPGWRRSTPRLSAAESQELLYQCAFAAGQSSAARTTRRWQGVSAALAVLLAAACLPLAAERLRLPFASRPPRRASTCPAPGEWPPQRALAGSGADAVEIDVDAWQRPADSGRFWSRG